MRPKIKVGAYTEKPFVCITIFTRTIGSSKWGVGAYTEMGAYLGDDGTYLKSMDACHEISSLHMAEVLLLWEGGRRGPVHFRYLYCIA